MSRTLKNHSFIAVKPLFFKIQLLALGYPLGSVLNSKNLLKTIPKSTPSVKKRLPKRMSKMISNFDTILFNFGLQNGGQKTLYRQVGPPFLISKCVFSAILATGSNSYQFPARFDFSWESPGPFWEGSQAILAFSWAYLDLFFSTHMSTTTG